jgi:hypothetical protein
MQATQEQDDGLKGSLQDLADPRMAGRTHEEGDGRPEFGFELRDIGVTGDLGMSLLEEQPSHPLRSCVTEKSVEIAFVEVGCNQ